ncbi:MFS transporter [Pseudogracilibacillus sp. SO30301A]|uniref:MFS transporter n=1 Tax=Pseudogracilibacillus sp. SO30301A TaxID=3098291 RepID=UPI00300E075F
MNKNFSLLLTGQSLANIGDVLYMVGIISAIFGLTGSATVVSFVPFTITTSMFVSNLLTPLLIERVNLKWLLAGSQLGKTILIVVLGLLLTGLSGTNYYLIFLIISGVALLDGCANPIMHSMIPQYVNSDKLVQANGIAETVLQLIQTVMWFVGSLFLVLTSPQQIVWVVSILFVVSSVLLCFLESVDQQEEEAQKGKLDQIKKGWNDLLSTPVLRNIAVIEILETIAGTVWIAAILYVFVNETLQVGEEWWGFINGSFFLGLIVGSIYCIKYSTVVEKYLSKLILISSLFSFVVTILFGVTSVPIIALLLSLGIGISEQIRAIPLQTIIQTSISKKKLTTVYTSLGAVSTGVFGVASLVMGILADLVGVRSVFLISGVMLAIVTVIVYRNKHLFVRNIVE